MNNEKYVDAKEMIMTAFSNIERAELENTNKLFKSWKYVIQSIKSKAENGENLGMNLYAHSRIIDLKNGILLVEADHPGWIQTLRIYQKYIITGLTRGVPESKINSLAFRLKGTDVELHNKITEEKIRSDMKQRMENEQKAIDSFDAKNNVKNSEISQEKKPLPENLQRIFDRMKNDMLTKEE